MATSVELSSLEPSPSSDTLIKLSTPNGSEVYLVGTAHFSKKSAQDVVKAIRAVKPSVLVLELCPERAFMLTIDEHSLLEQNRTITFERVRAAISEKGFAQGLIYMLFLKASASITEKLGLAPGSEFRAGAREAMNVEGCNIVLGDRPFNVTVARAVASLTLWQKITIVYQIFRSDYSITPEDVEKCKDADMLQQMLKELGGKYPGLKNVILDERNLYLAHSIYNEAQKEYNNQGPKKVIAVVGIGHIGGIVENWGKTTDEEILAISEMPKTSRTRIVVTKSIKYCTIALLIYVGYRTITPSSIQQAVVDKISSLRS